MIGAPRRRVPTLSRPFLQADPASIQHRPSRRDRPRRYSPETRRARRRVGAVAGRPSCGALFDARAACVASRAVIMHDRSHACAGTTVATPGTGMHAEPVWSLRARPQLAMARDRRDGNENAATTETARLARHGGHARAAPSAYTTLRARCATGRACARTIETCVDAAGPVPRANHQQAGHRPVCRRWTRSAVISPRYRAARAEARRSGAALPRVLAAAAGLKPCMYIDACRADTGGWRRAERDSQQQ